MNSLRVLREVTGVEPFALASLEFEKEVLEYDDGSKWVDNDHPRDVGIAHALGRYGGRFAVADDNGGIVAGPYRALDKAEKARASAKMTVSAEVFDVEDDEPGDEVAQSSTGTPLTGS